MSDNLSPDLTGGKLKVGKIWPKDGRVCDLKAQEIQSFVTGKTQTATMSGAREVVMHRMLLDAVSRP